MRCLRSKAPSFLLQEENRQRAMEAEKKKMLMYFVFISIFVKFRFGETYWGCGGNGDVYIVVRNNPHDGVAPSESVFFGYEFHFQVGSILV